MKVAPGCIAILVTLPVALGAARADARDEAILDDFISDPDYTDGEPLTWGSEHPCCPALVELVPGEGLRLEDESGNTNAGFLATEEVFAGDATVRVRSTADSAVYVFVHLDLDAATGYGAFVCDTCVDGSRHLVGLYRADGWGVTPLELTRPAGFDPGEGDVRLEISTQGEFVECRVWPEAADRPDAPVFRIRDGRYRSGAAAFAVDPSHDGLPAPAFLRWAEITISRPDPVAFGRGDCNDDGGVDLSDAVCILNWLFLDGVAPGCIAVTNTNGAAGVDISDATYLLNHLFLEGPAPAAPYPDCGFGTLPSDEGTCESPPRRCQP